MATITIRNLDETVKQRLRLQAAAHNHSMEEEVRSILRSAVQKEEEEGGVGSRIHARFAAAGGIEMPQPIRRQKPRTPEFGE